MKPGLGVFILSILLLTPVMIFAENNLEKANGGLPQKTEDRSFIGAIFSVGHAVFNSANYNSGDFASTCPYSFVQLGNGFSTGINYEYYLNDQIDGSEYSSLLFKLVYKNGSAENELQYPNYLTNLLNLSSQSPEQNAVHGKIESRFETIDFSCLYNYYMFDRLAISIGAGIAYKIADRFKESVVINEQYRETTKFSENFKPVRFENDYTAVIHDGKSWSNYPFLFSFSASINYNLIFGEWILKPYVAYTMSLNDLGDTYESHPNDISMGLMIQHEIKLW